MDDKFILMGLNDEQSKKVAEILGNKTCKKIIDYLADIKEASEKDISDALNIPINTAEYNLKKLIGVGLVEKTKNFFWSKKGKKIPMYKLANKHIVISPKSVKPNLNALKTIIPIITAVILIAILINNLNSPIQTSSELRKFNSLNELKVYLKENKLSGGISDLTESVSGVMTKSSNSLASSSEASEYSSTNIQVQGVDEADIVKNDGKYIYTISGNKVIIVHAYPADEMKILSEINFSGNVGEIFINNNKLIVFSTDYLPIYKTAIRCEGSFAICPIYSEPRTSLYIYDISNRESPKLVQNISTSGNYIDSRMIGDYVYTITNQYINEEPHLPYVTENGKVRAIEPSQIYYPKDIQDNNFQYTIISAINIDNGEINEKSLLTGYTSNIYVSQNNIYAVSTKYPSWNSNNLYMEKTSIQKIAIDRSNIEFVASGEVPGHILNQFSMDENDNYFRIATTLGEVWNSQTPSKNNIYLLDEKLNLVGSLVDLAPGEKIYSVRFIGERAYMVTFKKVDPLFVIDLSDPKNPSVLGKLKIPGYSDYLHPYDENHLIGIGKEAVDASTEEIQGRNLDFAWYQGVKMAIFDVSDVANPKEMYKVVIGDRGTDSEALQDHKAFLFDKKKELLVLPITLAELPEEKKIGSSMEYGQQTFQGAYVYKINLEEGFNFKGRITHVSQEEELKSGYYYDWNSQIKRSLYIDNTLYTISNKKIKSNDLGDLTEINNVELPVQEIYYNSWVK